MKTHKIDLRLTPEQYEWVERQAKNSTVGKSTFLRQLLESIRQEDESGPRLKVHEGGGDALTVQQKAEAIYRARKIKSPEEKECAK